MISEDSSRDESERSPNTLRRHEAINLRVNYEHAFEPRRNNFTPRIKLGIPSSGIRNAGAIRYT